MKSRKGLFGERKTYLKLHIMKFKGIKKIKMKVSHGMCEFASNNVSVLKVTLKNVLLPVTLFVFCTTVAFAQATIDPDIDQTNGFSLRDAIEFPTGSYPPGYLKQTDFPNTCFDYMGAVDFTSAYRFVTSYTSVPPGWTGGLLNPYTQRLVGFTSPMVADLDLDGYPEIIALSTYDVGSGLALNNGIQIFNGQTGKSISRLLFGNSETQYYYNYEAYHPSPSSVSYADVDRDGIVEAIFAFPYYSILPAQLPYNGKVVAYKLRPSKDASGKTTSYSMEFMWASADKYNDSSIPNYEKAIPQIVDIDGDGVPEVIVYNKVYNAVTGSLLLNLDGSITQANVGYTQYAHLGDRYVNFSYAYDVDMDGNYDLAAGGKAYRMYKDGGTLKYDIIPMSGVPDGRTGVADINGDGIPDIVTYSRPSTTTIRLVVWNANTHIVDGITNDVIENPNTPVPYIIADYSFPAVNVGEGSSSYLFIGDIDGKVQTVGDKSYRLPEIAILCNKPTNAQFAAMPRHPNVGSSIPNTISALAVGAVYGFTWDAEASAASNALKLSFVLEHNDRSVNTGFTMFDFDNDGMQEICYRDERTLRIIKASTPYVKLGSSDSNVVLFEKAVSSFTGFEYPVIADIDNDASAEMIVMGCTAADTYYGYVYALGTDGDKFAPALPVWNQAMYDPFKIDPYTLQTPIGAAPNRLDKKYTYTRLIKDESGAVTSVHTGYNPYNGTLLQASRYTLEEVTYDGTTYSNAYDPVVFLTEAYIINEKDSDTSKRPVINGTNLQFYIGNNATAETDIATNTPIRVYYGKIEDDTGTRKYIATTLYDCGITTPVKAGQEVMVTINVSSLSSGGFGLFIIRLGDGSTGLNTTAPTWHFGANRASDLANSPVTEGLGLSLRAYRDCDWSDQTIKVSQFLLVDDAATVQAQDEVIIDVLANDIYPDTYNPTFNSSIITVQPAAGSISFTGTGLNSKIIYKHNGKANLTDGIDKFTYELSYTDPASGETVTVDADVYVYILQNTTDNFAACYGSDITIALKELPIGTTFGWYSDAAGTAAVTAPTTISNLTTTLTYYVKPTVTATAYSGLTFPAGKLTILPIGTSSDNAKMRWTGAIDNEWSNPANWVLVNGSTETATLYVPTKCVAVEIPKVTTNYPVLTSNGEAGFVSVGDRAMLQNTHKLDYDSASVEVNFTADERNNRWVMYSAPTRKVYSGDFILFDDQGKPKTNPPAVYMSFFQSQHPDKPGVAAQESRFTETFGNVGVLLYLGKSFNIWINKDVDATTPFKFPSRYETYDYYVHGEWGNESLKDSTSHTLDRHEGAVKVNGQFIADEAGSNVVYEYNATDGSFKLPPPDDQAGFQMIMIPNPYMAYMDMAAFLQENSTVLQRGYKVWKGQDDSFISYQYIPAWNGYTWVIDDTDIVTSSKNDLTSYQYISPFQSFIVSKNAAYVNQTVKLTYKPETMLTTSPLGTYYQGDYKLRSVGENDQTEGLMRITAKFLDQTNSTLLANSPGASNSLTDDDSRKLFFDGRSSVSVYTMTPEKDALAINVSGDFSGREIPVGVRLKGKGNLTFDFSGVKNFKYQAWFVDGTKEIDLSKVSTYTTSDIITGTESYYEINNRFKLRFGDATSGIDNSLTSAVRITTFDHKIQVTSDDIMQSIEIISSLGSVIYKDKTASDNYTVSVQPGQVYVVKVRKEKGLEIKKVIVK